MILLDILVTVIDPDLYSFLTVLFFLILEVTIASGDFFDFSAFTLCHFLLISPICQLCRYLFVGVIDASSFYFLFLFYRTEAWSPSTLSTFGSSVSFSLFLNSGPI